MTQDELEFSISQYADGTLPDNERAAMAIRLATDADAAALLAEYRLLDSRLKALPLPAVRWEMLSATISHAVHTSREEAQQRSYRMPTWVRSIRMPLAMAASVVIAVGIGFRIARMHSSVPSISHPTPAVAIVTHPVPAIQVFGPHAEESAQPVEVQVAVGPSAASRDEPIVVHYSDDVISRPSRVAVASGINPEHDTVPLPSDMQ